MWVMRVSSFCWMFVSQACSRDAMQSYSIASKSTVSGNCFLKMSEEESLAGKYMECDKSVLGVLGAWNVTTVASKTAPMFARSSKIQILCFNEWMNF